MLPAGLYELVVSRSVAQALSGIPDNRKALEPLSSIEAPDVLSAYVARVVRLGLAALSESPNGIEAQVELANRLIDLVGDAVGFDALAAHAIDPEAGRLLSLLDEKDPLLAVGKTAADVVRPATPLAHGALFTGAVRDPQLYSELRREIASADRIDMLVSFVKWSGLRLIYRDLEAFARRGGVVRVITTSYMGATDIRAVEELAHLPDAQIKVSYDTKRTRLHAKAYVFHRATGFSTAYVGSSNLTNAAISSGLEWNVKIAAQELPETFAKIGETFEGYWRAAEFETYGPHDRERLERAIKAERGAGTGNGGLPVYVLDVEPYPYQREILNRLHAERAVRGKTRNLVVAATGTGKTVISALDFRRFRAQNPGCRLLFVAHREEILKQSIATFRTVLKDANFGEVAVGGNRPASIDDLFISIQTFNAQRLHQKVDPGFYDFIVVDEFHHAAAPSYQVLLSYFKPRILLGLTATPERMDGKSVLQYFDDRIAAEIRLPDAIDRKLLCPFQYFGVADDVVDLAELTWRRGGYDQTELNMKYVHSGLTARRRADLVVSSLLRYVSDMDEVKGLGFCVSVEHAAFMSAYFNEHGIPSMHLTGASPAEDRSTAQKRLVRGEIRFIFVVDIYNEGVDIPQVNTVLFLRPTESLTVFIQQLGRGLRLAPGKECLTVLDFIGHAHKRYSFEGKFASLLMRTDRNVAAEIADDFVSLPAGCHIQLEKIAEQYVLENIKASYSTRAGLLARIKAFYDDTDERVDVGRFLSATGMDARQLYRFGSFARLCVQAGVRADFAEPAEERLARALRRFASIDSRRWILFLLDVLPLASALDVAGLPAVEQRMFQMFYFTIWGQAAQNWDSIEVKVNLAALAASPMHVEELLSLLAYRFDRIDFEDSPADVGLDCPLDVHCTYTRDQLFVALDLLNPSTVREGVRWLPEKNVDVLLVTLNKDDKDYSPTTMYEDYPVSETLFHWQSQSTTAVDSHTGQRYINHERLGSKVLLFVRELKTDRVLGQAAAYTLLGTARYVSHQGSRPMNVIWELDRPIPARFLQAVGKGDTV